MPTTTYLFDNYHLLLFDNSDIFVGIMLITIPFCFVFNVIVPLMIEYPVSAIPILVVLGRLENVDAKGKQFTTETISSK